MEALDRVRNLEAQLDEAKREVVKELSEKRAALSLSLRDAGKRVRLTAAALSNIERGKSFKTQTIARIARIYVRLAA